MRCGISRAVARVQARRPDWTTAPSPDDVDYGGVVFRRASDFVRSRAAGRPASDVDAGEIVDTTMPVGWWSDLAGFVALVRLATFLPVEDVELSSSAAGDALRVALAGRTFGVPRNRLCAAVFEVPAAVPERPTGKRNQALRTALTAAARADLRVRPVNDVDERRAVAADAARRVPRLQPWARTAPGLVEHDWWVAEDGDGVVVGIATVAVDARWASLVTLFGLPGRGAESHARFLLHHTVVRMLSQSGVRHLAVLDHSPLLLAPGPQHLQRVLGYRPTRLRRPTRTVESGARPWTVDPAPTARRPAVARAEVAD